MGNKIKVGMKTDDLIKLFGKPDGSMKENELMSAMGQSGAFTLDARDEKDKKDDREYWLYMRPEGEYRLIVHKGKVVEINTQP